MKLKNNTVLITGGSSGIGLELSSILMRNGNKVIICGRSKKKLLAAQASAPALVTYQCDLSQKKDCEDFAKWLAENHPTLNVLINNAATVNKIDFFEDQHAIELAETEYQTNLIAPLRLIKMLYPVMITNDSPVVINITTGLVYAPRMIYPFYNSSKSALHSFTQTLRLRLKNDKTRVIEVMFPAVDTPWHKGNPPKIAISTEKAVTEMIKGLEKGKEEIRIGGVKLLYPVSRLAPGFAFRKINQIK